MLRDMWDLPRPGPEPVSPASAGRFSTTAPPGKPAPNILLHRTGAGGGNPIRARTSSSNCLWTRAPPRLPAQLPPAPCPQGLGGQAGITLHQQSRWAKENPGTQNPNATLVLSLHLSGGKNSLKNSQESEQVRFQDASAEREPRHRSVDGSQQLCRPWAGWLKLQAGTLCPSDSYFKGHI